MIKKLTHHHPIYQNGNQVGRINLVTSSNTPQIEYDLDEEYWGKGIMTKELAKYLLFLKTKNITKLMALVRVNNHASKKVLVKNGFVGAKYSNGLDVFFISLAHDSRVRGILSKVVEVFNEKRE